MGYPSFRSFWQQVERAKIKSKALWGRMTSKDGFTCFRPIGQIVERCVSRYSESTVVEPEDGKLHEDRPLLKHRHSVGFTATATRAKNIGKSASKRLKRQADSIAKNIPSPCRIRNRLRKADAFEPCPDDQSQEAFCVAARQEAFYEDGSIFEIGDDEIDSSDEEEQMWQTHPLETSPGQLNEALKSWGSPGEAIGEDAGEAVDELQPLGVGLKLGGLDRMRSLNLASPEASISTFYMGTPRDDGLC